MQRYRPIGQYGLIGDCRSAALVGPDGSIDWFCWPRFDSPAMFARILDAEQGGFWRVGPAQPNGAGAMRYRRTPRCSKPNIAHRKVSFASWTQCRRPT